MANVILQKDKYVWVSYREGLESQAEIQTYFPTCTKDSVPLQLFNSCHLKTMIQG